MDDIILAAFRKIPFYNLPYKYPNMWGVFSDSQNGNDNDKQELRIPSKTQQTPNLLSVIKEYFFFTLAFFPPFILVVNTMVVLARPILSKKADHDSELTFLAVAICIPTVLIGVCVWVIEYSVMNRLKDAQNVIARITEFHLNEKNDAEGRGQRHGKMTRRKKLETKLLSKFLDVYMMNCFVIGIAVSSTPFFLHVDPTYFLMRTFFPYGTKSLEISVVRSIWMAVTSHRWILTSTNGALYIVGSLYFLGSSLGKVISKRVGSKGQPDPSLTMRESERNMVQSVSSYRQLYILVHCLNSTFRWVLAVIVQGVWLELILSFSTCVWCSRTLLLTKPMTYMVFPFLFGFNLILSWSMLSLAGVVNNLASKFVQIPLGFIPNRKYYKRVKRGLRPIGVQVGNFEFIHSKYFSLFLLSALDQIIGLLMSVEIRV